MGRITQARKSPSWEEAEQLHVSGSPSNMDTSLMCYAQSSLTTVGLFGLCNSVNPARSIFQLMGYSLLISAHCNMCL